MNVLIVGGAGHVGTILRPALEQAHRCRYLDLRPVEGAEDRTVVGDVNDDAIIVEAVEGQDALVYLAMGVAHNGQRNVVSDINAAFDVNVRGMYRTLVHAMKAGVRRVYLASSLSVYKNFYREMADEARPADAWDTYGLSKRVAEFICQAAAQEYPDATIVALRLLRPCNEQEWPRYAYDPERAWNLFATGPEDMRRLFLRALEFDRPGFHLMQASGDVNGDRVPNDRVRELIGWTPENR